MLDRLNEKINVLLFISGARQEPAAKLANIRAELRLFQVNIITVSMVAHLRPIKLWIHFDFQLTGRFIEWGFTPKFVMTPKVMISFLTNSQCNDIMRIDLKHKYIWIKRFSSNPNDLFSFVRFFFSSSIFQL